MGRIIGIANVLRDGRSVVLIPAGPSGFFDVITSLVSLEHGVYSWEKLTS
jgi:hypothetical protein